MKGGGRWTAVDYAKGPISELKVNSGSPFFSFLPLLISVMKWEPLAHCFHSSGSLVAWHGSVGQRQVSAGSSWKQWHSLMKSDRNEGRAFPFFCYFLDPVSIGFSLRLWTLSLRPVPLSLFSSNNKIVLVGDNMKETLTEPTSTILLIESIGERGYGVERSVRKSPQNGSLIGRRQEGSGC